MEKGNCQKVLSRQNAPLSSSRNVSMRDIGAAGTLYPAYRHCGVTERVANGFTRSRHRELDSGRTRRTQRGTLMI